MNPPASTTPRSIEEAYRQLVEQSVQGLAIVQDGRFVFANCALAEMLGYTVDDLINLSPLDALKQAHPDDRAAALDRLKPSAAGEPLIGRFEFRVARPDGTMRWLEVTSSPLDLGSQAALYVVMADVSDHKQAEAARRESEALRRRAQEMEALYQTSLEINAEPDVSRLLPAIVERAALLVGARMGGLYLLQAGGDVLKLVVSHNLPGDYVGTTLRLGEGLSGRIAQTGELMMVEDYRAWESRAQAFADSPFRRVLGVPLKVRGRVIGVINITDDVRAGPFDDDEVRLVRLFADQAAIAVENARLIEEAQQHARHLALLNDITQASVHAPTLDDTLQTLADRLGELFDADHVFLTLWDEARHTPIPSAAYGPLRERYRRTSVLPGEHTMTAAVLSAGHVLAADDATDSPHLSPRIAEQAPLRSVMALPLIAGDQKLGAALIGFDRPHHFTPDEIARGEWAAPTIALAVAKARSLEAEREQHTLAQALSASAGALNATLNFQEVLDRILTSVERVVPHDGAIIALTEGVDAAVIVRYRGHAETDISPALLNQRYTLSQFRNLREMAETGRPLAVPDTQVYDGWVTRPETQWTRSFAGAPIHSKDRLLGFLGLFSLTPGFFTQAHAERLQAFADQAAVAIDNSRLFEMTRRQLEELTILHAVSAASTEAVSEDDLMARASQIIGATLFPDNFSLWLLDDNTATLRAHRASRGLPPGARQTAIQVGQGIIGRVADTGRPRRVDDAAGEPDYLSLSGQMRSELCVPLKTGDRVLGVIDVEDRLPNAFSDADEQLLHTLARQLAAALSRQRSEAAERDQRGLAEALQKTAAALNSTLDFDEVLDRVLANLGQVVPHDAAGFMLLDADSGIARMVRGQGYSDIAGVLALRFALADIAHLRQMLATGRPLAIGDTRRYPGWVASPALPWERAYAGAPVKVKGQTVGFLQVVSGTPGFFTPAHAERLHVFADQAAIAIQNAQLFEAEREQRAWAEALRDSAAAVTGTLHFDEVLDRILDNIGRVVPHDAAGFMLLDAENESARVVRGHGYPDLEGVLAERFRVADTATLRFMVDTGQPLAVRDAHQFEGWVRTPATAWEQSFAGAPVCIKGHVVGFVQVVSRTPDFFTPKHAGRLQAFADQAAVAIENARLFGETRHRAERLGLINEISATVNSQLDLDAILHAAVDGLARALSVPQSALALFDEGRRSLTILADHPAAGNASEAGLELSLENNLSMERVLATRRPLAIGDAQHDPLLAGVRAILTWRRVESILIVPLIVRGEVIGTIGCDAIDSPRQFGEEEIELAQTIANLAAVRIEQARLLDAERRRLREFEAIQQASLSLTASLDLPQVLDIILNTVLSLVPLEDTHIFFYDGERLIFAAAVTREGRLDKPVLPPRSGGFTYTVASTGRMMTIEDTRLHPLPIGAPAGRGGAIIGLPLTIGATVVGVMNVYFPDARRIPESERRVLGLLASHAAIAIQNAQLFEAARRSQSEMEQRVIERTAELESERHRLQTILDAAGEGVYIISADRRIQYTNPALESITGYSRDELVGQTPRLWRSGHTPPDTIEDLERSLKQGTSWRGELLNRRKDGSLFDAALTVSPLRSAADQLLGFVCVQRDITRLKELDRLKDQFVSRIGHELRTPVANIKLYLELLERGRAEKREQYMRTLAQETERLRDLVDGFLEIAQFDAGAVAVHFTPVDLNSVVDGLVSARQSIAAEHGLSVSPEPDAALPRARADQALAAQALANLLENALNYTPHGGRITLSTAVRRDGEQDWITATVTDTGPGITRAEMPRVFERFYRGEAARDFATPGTGLGLAISKEIIDRLGGRITVDSQPGEGAAFTIWLRPYAPLAAKAA